MLYLEDYLEMIEHLPQELRDRFTEIRELDLQVHNAMDNLEEEVKAFFSNAKKMKPDTRETEFNRIRSEYLKTLEDAEEKVSLANQIHDLVSRYLRRLDQELAKFKIELDADNSGITEILERRSLELDLPPQVPNIHGVSRSDRNKNKQQYLMPSAPTSSSLNYSRDNPPGVFSPSLNARLPFRPSPAAASASSSGQNGMFSSPLTPILTGQNTPGYPLSLQGYHNHPLAANNAIAAAASQAIAATQQMQGRRTASLKASIDAIHSTPGFLSSQNLGLSSDPFSGSLLPSGYPSGLVSNDTSSGVNNSSRGNKRIRSSSHFQDSDASESVSYHQDAFGANGNSMENWNLDPDEQKYCMCQQVSYGEMVACDNQECEYEWFHYACVQLTSAPKGKWYCPTCQTKMKKNKSRSDRNNS